MLDIPEIAARYSLDQQACDELHDLMQRSNVRWGLDAGHKEVLDLPALEHNTWQQGCDRLFTGYAMAGGQVRGGGEVDAGGEHWRDMAAIALQETGRAVIFGRFVWLLERLRQWRDRLGGQRSAVEWQQLVNCLLDDFFHAGDDDDDRLQEIRDVMETLRREAGEQQLSLPLLILWLEDSLGSQQRRGRYFSGGVTFCGMRPMRSLPFRQICVLGMNDQAFPRRETQVEFDAMTQHWRPGDPRKGDEDRYLLLETVLCARDRLYFSYTGRGLQDNEARQPSVLLRELLDFLDSRYIPDDAASMSGHITTVHSMQPFSPRNYDGAEDPEKGHRLPAFDRYWCDVARALNEKEESTEGHGWPDGPKDDSREPDETLTLENLRRFLVHPVEYFFRHRLGIHLGDEEALEDEEDFVLTGLSRWQVADRLIRDHLHGRETPRVRLEAEGLLPHGALAAAADEQLREFIAPLDERLAPYRPAAFEPVDLTLAMPDRLLLTGQVTQYIPGEGLLHFAASRFKGKQLLALWVEHLALCAGGRLTRRECSRLETMDGTRRFSVMGKQAALEELQVLVGLYRSGMRYPLPIFPRASFALAVMRHEGKEGLGEARQAWRGNPFSNVPPEQADPYIDVLVQSGIDDPLGSEAFEHYAQQLYAKALQEAEVL